MKDISGGGAKLVHELDEDLPTRFLLSRRPFCRGRMRGTASTRQAAETF
jgi:hypothetical protein